MVNTGDLPTAPTRRNGVSQLHPDAPSAFGISSVLQETLDEISTKKLFRNRGTVVDNPWIE